MFTLLESLKIALVWKLFNACKLLLTAEPSQASGEPFAAVWGQHVESTVLLPQVDGQASLFTDLSSRETLTVKSLSGLNLRKQSA